jgi:membrane protein YdbS with pleckstrin-like domain
MYSKRAVVVWNTKYDVHSGSSSSSSSSKKVVVVVVVVVVVLISKLRISKINNNSSK